MISPPASALAESPAMKAHVASTILSMIVPFRIV
jgi:hypothetical protein